MKLWKCLIPLPLCLVLAVLILPTTADAATEGYYTYTVKDGEATITDCDAAISGNITIPSTLGGYPVTTIGNSAFSWCENLINVTIPDSVTTIGDEAFFRCYSLTSVAIPDSVIAIGDDAFLYCTSLTSIWVDAVNPNFSSDNKGVLFNEDKTTLIQAPSTIVSYTIPDSVTAIGNSAFYYCRSLTSVTIGNSVTTIGKSAFYSCTSLTSVTIPDSVTTIDDDAFLYCTSLTSITIGNSVTIIGNSAFGSCDSLNNVKIGNGVTTIGNSAFRYCDSLIGVTIPDSVTTIGKYAFEHCYDLNSVTMGNSVIAIGKCAFKHCTSLTSVTMGKNVTTIGDEAFYCCSLTSVTIPDSATTIGKSAFSYCDSLTSVTMGNSMTAIGDEAFYSCDGLTDVWYTGSQADWNKISIGSFNSDLTSANWHYNTCSIHTYDHACDTDCNICGYTRLVTHDYKWVVDQQATCGSGGMEHEECTVCHIKRSEGTVIPATNAHIYDAACDADCNVCKADRTPPHTPGTELIYDETVHWRECTLCKEKLEQQAHLDNGEGGCTVCDWKAWIFGDVDGNETLSTDDAVYLLLYVMFGAEDYPVPDGMSLDLNADGKVDTNDAVYLLLRVMFGAEDYPLAA